MRNVLLIGAFVVIFAACAGDKPEDPQRLAPQAQPVGSTGSAPAETKPSGNAAPAVESRGAGESGSRGGGGPRVADPVRDPAVTTPEVRSAPAVREITIPAGTMLSLSLASAVGSEASNVEDPVRATLSRAVTINGVRALPAGTVVSGHVTDAARSARVKGRGRVAFRFNALDVPGEGGRVSIRTGTIARVAPGTKKRDAAKIGGGAAGGAIIGGLLGGGDGAAKGAAIGGGAGTAVVLSTRGKEVLLPAGTPLSVKLAAPVTVRVRAN